VRHEYQNLKKFIKEAYGLGATCVRDDVLKQRPNRVFNQSNLVSCFVEELLNIMIFVRRFTKMGRHILILHDGISY